MEPETQEKNLEDTKELADSLHNKGKLPSLRTYQGDVASFIQSKDQSLAGLALKNREKKEKREEKVEFLAPEGVKLEKPEKEKIPSQTQRGSQNRSVGFFIAIVGIMLLIASGVVLSYSIFSHLKNRPVEISSVSPNTILKVTNSTPLPALFDLAQIAIEAADPKHAGVITALETDESAESFIERQNMETPSALTRSLEPNFLIGLYGIGKEPADVFFILKTKDYGIAYRDMLLWEKDLPRDLGGIIGDSFTDYTFKDLLVKNKDTRSFSSKFGKSALIYTFLNQNTILITQSEESLEGLVNAFATQSVVR